MRQNLWIIGFALMVCGSCKSKESESSLFDESPAQITFGISVDTDGNVQFGHLTRRPELLGTISDGRASVDIGRSESSEPVRVQSERQTLLIEMVPPGPGDTRARSGYLVRDAAERDYKLEENLPEGIPRVSVVIAEEIFASIEEAEATIDLQLTEERLATQRLLEKHDVVLAEIRSTVRIAALAHNRSFAETTVLAQEMVAAAGRIVQNLATDPRGVLGQLMQRTSTAMRAAYDQVEALQPGAEKEALGKMLRFASAALRVADKYYTMGDLPSAEVAIAMAREIADVALGFVPLVGWAKDLQEAITGRSIILQRSLTHTERTWAIVGAVSVGIGSKLKFVGKAFDVMSHVFLKVGASDAAILALKEAEGLYGALRVATGGADEKVRQIFSVLRDHARYAADTGVWGEKLKETLQSLRHVAMWSKTEAASALRSALDRFNRRRGEFPAIDNAVEFVDDAKSFAVNPPNGSIVSELADGGKRIFDPVSGVTVVVGRSGVPIDMTTGGL